MPSSPNFIFIGPSKSGSTWIYKLLKSHPDVYVPVAKDLYFFDKYYNKGVLWYEKHFDARMHEKAIGELSHDYFSSEIAIERIHSTYPEIKIICCLRNPYDRALSSYRFFKRNGLVNGDFLDAVQKYPMIIDEGRYYTHLSYVYSKFPEDQVLVLFFDDLEKDPQEFAKTIFSFLNVDPAFQSPFIGKKVNVSSSPRSHFFAKIAKHIAVALRNAGFPNLVGMLKMNRVILRFLYKDDESNNNVYESQYKYFTSDMVSTFNSEISSLETITKRELHSWKVAL